MDSLAQLLTERVGAHLGADPLVRRSDHADYQANGALAAARERRVSPRELAATTAGRLADDDLVADAEVSGPGFINLTLAPAVMWTQVAARLADERLGVSLPLVGQRVVVDYSNPNIAKEMHVGHLRSTVIGDALVRLFRFAGADVVRQNHLGDWGTPFGMLIAYLDEHKEPVRATGSGADSVSRLTALYQAARAEFDTDPAFVDQARARVVDLQAGEPSVLAAWRAIVDESQRYFTEVYELLGVELTAADAIAESFYNDELPGIAATLAERGLAEASDGALCIFFSEVRGRDGTPVPLIIRKSDGGFGYAVTDLAAVRHRVSALGADRICYVVDSRQALHFRMVFETARRAGWLPATVSAEHVSFGTVLQPDGTPLRTRAGDTTTLVSLLHAAVDRAAKVIAEKSPNLSPVDAAIRAREIGIGAVKYADLSTGRTRDYVFDLDRMVSLTGDTGVYLQYAHARACSILRKAGDAGHRSSVDTTVPVEAAERRLALLLDEFGDAVSATVASVEPHRLCAHLFDVAQALAGFWNACPVLGAPSDSVRGNRLALCELTARTLGTGLGLLGIAAPQRL